MTEIQWPFILLIMLLFAILLKLVNFIQIAHALTQTWSIKEEKNA